MSRQARQGGERGENGMNTDSQTAKERKDMGAVGIKELSDSEGEQVERRQAYSGRRLMAHRTQCVAENQG